MSAVGSAALNTSSSVSKNSHVILLMQPGELAFTVKPYDKICHSAGFRALGEPVGIRAHKRGTCTAACSQLLAALVHRLLR